MRNDHWLTHIIDVDHDPLALLDREWLLTNGTGAFAAGTAAGCPTRRYHGLLVAATEPPVGRIVALNQVWEELILHRPDDSATQSLAFSTLMFRSREGGRVFAPAGYELLRRFERGLSVRWRYVWGEITFERELMLHWQEQAATLRYRVQGLNAANCRATLRVHPMATLRDFHSLARADDAMDYKAEGHTLRIYREATCLTLDLAAVGKAATRSTASSKRARQQPRGSGDGARGGDAGAGGGVAVAEADNGETGGAFHTAFEPNPHWWYGAHYPIETERGQDDREDLFVPGAMTIELPESGESQVTLTAALGSDAVAPCEDLSQRAEHLTTMVQALAPASPASDGNGQTASRKKQRGTSKAEDPVARLLALAADDFVVRRRIDGQSLSTIIAGYPWFADWGRDTFIALPGLLLETQRHDEARAALRAFATHMRHGLVPNRFDDYHNQAAHYNTVDGSLWFVQAALQYLHATGDDDAWRDWLAPACLEIVAAYHAGTEFDIRCDDDGLVTAGSPRTQLTWMDAAVGDRVFTPRPGKCVEVNALWYNALMGLADALEQHPRTTKRTKQPAPNARSERSEGRDAPTPPTTPDDLRKLAQQVKRSFNDLFWDEERGHLLDHIWTDPHGHTQRDATCRPNQLFALALPHSPLAQNKQRRVLATVRERLLTPVGLRTLPRDDPHYHGQYRGDQLRRDEAYHQGTIWPWLIGPYAEAVLRVGRFGPKARSEVREAIAPLLDVLLADRAEDEAQVSKADKGRAESPDSNGHPAAASPPPYVMSGAIGQLHEIYEAEPDAQGRFRPVGAFAQAWSIAEVLRIWRMLAR